MKYILTFFLFLCTFISIQAQKHELGLSLGATNYKGDFTNDHFELKNYFPGFLLFYKNNITPAVGLRYHLMMGGLKANDKSASDPVYVKRNTSFNTLIYEGALQLEYNFLNYRSQANPIKWSPYFTAGLGVFYANPGSSLIMPCIPIGVGLRVIAGQNWNIGIEAVARKTFTDMLDNTNGNQYGGNSDTQDWYLYNGFTFSYTFYDVYCPRPRR